MAEVHLSGSVISGILSLDDDELGASPREHVTCDEQRMLDLFRDHLKDIARLRNNPLTVY
jgi:hypothetical protein